MKPHLPSHSYFIPIALLLLAHKAHTLCYWPNGIPAEHYFPCSPTSNMCCGEGETCYKDTLCLHSHRSQIEPEHLIQSYWRGACRGPDWKEEGCNEVCVHSWNSGSGPSPLTPCGDDTFCCFLEFQDESCSCRTGVGVFDITAAKPNLELRATRIESRRAGIALGTIAAICLLGFLAFWKYGRFWPRPNGRRWYGQGILDSTPEDEYEDDDGDDEPSVVVSLESPGRIRLRVNPQAAGKSMDHDGRGDA
ncbi:uncharacterized protein BDR25DRAFT_305772 [Lindgomyces ingoldianus]|uniref:Uncharacterized protein n=1 Tax=Lindgomyces ingoldianus TaxID=673940 RepID=A0ACB6QLA4_9PLEO|nr:uncharacterized protein BDR25DRAFT_305772 [Lindgomyces ingoldianus]KAF2466910.1 hypothetical protein BDR25DRAFT_305772 [Lindgomyces ingoldianus]